MQVCIGIILTGTQTAIVLKQQLIIEIGSYALEGLQDNLGDIVKVETIGSRWLVVVTQNRQPKQK